MVTEDEYWGPKNVVLFSTEISKEKISLLWLTEAPRHLMSLEVVQARKPILKQPTCSLGLGSLHPWFICHNSQNENKTRHVKGTVYDAPPVARTGNIHTLNWGEILLLIVSGAPGFTGSHIQCWQEKLKILFHYFFYFCILWKVQEVYFSHVSQWILQ